MSQSYERSSTQSDDGQVARGGPSVPRVNRACNYCRRLKMKCDLGESNEVPCKRCSTGGRECVLEQAKVRPEKIENERIVNLETQMTSMQSTLTELVSMLKTQGSSTSVRTPSTSLRTIINPRSNSPPDLQTIEAMDTLLQAASVNIDGDSSSPFNMALHGGAVNNDISPSVNEELVEDDCPPAGYEIMAPLRMMNRLASVAVERLRSESDRPRLPVEQRVEARLNKRRRVDDDRVPPVWPSKRREEYWRTYPDVVALGFISEVDGKRLFDQYFSTSHVLSPVYDKDYDTWESLRKRSPFSISTILSVAARASDGGGPMSEHQRHCLEHARKISLGTIYHPINRIEAVQAMLLLATYNDNGWLIGGHACRMAMDMGLDQAFKTLLKRGMGSNHQTPEEMEGDRVLVNGARTYFALYLFEHQMSYGNGRQTILREDDTIHKCRRFLDHPLSNNHDITLISSVELMALRSPLHTALTSSPNDPLDYRMIKDLQVATKGFEEWESEWNQVYVDQGIDQPIGLIRESLDIQKEYCCLFVNSQVLRNVVGTAGVKRMGPEDKALALKAIRNAQNALGVLLKGVEYAKMFRYAGHHTHVCVAFAASFLIRIARMFPHELDLRKTAKDVKAVADMLLEVPAGRYARSLRLLLQAASKQKIIPPPTRPGSPGANNSNAAASLSSWPMEPTRQFTEAALPYMQQEMSTSAPELPLFFNSDSLGQMESTMPNFGLESYFLPIDVDMMLADYSRYPINQNQISTDWSTGLMSDSAWGI